MAQKALTHLRLTVLCQQVWNAQDAEEECLVMAVRTGLNTELGSMVRDLIHPPEATAPIHAFVQVHDSLRKAHRHMCTTTVEQIDCWQLGVGNAALHAHRITTAGN